MQCVYREYFCVSRFHHALSVSKAGFSSVSLSFFVSLSFLLIWFGIWCYPCGNEADSRWDDIQPQYYILANILFPFLVSGISHYFHRLKKFSFLIVFDKVRFNEILMTFLIICWHPFTLHVFVPFSTKNHLLLFF